MNDRTKILIDRARKVLSGCNTQLQHKLFSTLSSVSKYSLTFDDEQRWKQFFFYNRQFKKDKIPNDKIIIILDLFDFSSGAISDIKKLYYEI